MWSTNEDTIGSSQSERGCAHVQVLKGKPLEETGEQICLFGWRHSRLISSRTSNCLYMGADSTQGHGLLCHL